MMMAGRCFISDDAGGSGSGVVVRINDVLAKMVLFAH